MNRRGALALAVLVAAAPVGCTEPRSDFMARVAEDCKAGDRAACNLLRSPPADGAFNGLSRTPSATRSLVQEDLEAMLRGMARARTAARPRQADGAR